MIGAKWLLCGLFHTFHTGRSWVTAAILAVAVSQGRFRELGRVFVGHQSYPCPCPLSHPRNRREFHSIPLLIASVTVTGEHWGNWHDLLVVQLVTNPSPRHGFGRELFHPGPTHVDPLTLLFQDVGFSVLGRGARGQTHPVLWKLTTTRPWQEPYHTRKLCMVDH